MQRNNSPILLATIALGLLAILGAAFLFLRPSSGPTGPVAVVPTPTPAAIERWVAARNIPPRTVVTTNMLRRAALTGPAPADALKNPSDLSGQITKEGIPAGQTVLLSSFTTRLGRVIPANFEVPTNYRAVAIYVDPDQTAAGLVDVGDRVDVIATHRLHIDKDNNTQVIGALDYTAGRSIARNLLVLAVDKSLNAPKPTPTPQPGEAGVVGGPPPAPTPPPPPPTPGQETRTRVLLAAPPDIATRLVAANDQGKLHVVIRNPMDADTAQTPETREYPSRTVSTKDAKAAAGEIGSAMGKGLRDGMGMGNVAEPALPVPSNMTPPEALPPMSTPSTPTGGDSATPTENTKEVTVIRGTEKTRVIVPQR